MTACQPACPADAIVFGNLNDPTQPRLEVEGAAAQLRAARGTQHAAADDVSGRAEQSESRARVVAPGSMRTLPRPRSTDESETRNLRHAAAHRTRATRSARSPTRSAASSSTRPQPLAWFVVVSIGFLHHGDARRGGHLAAAQGHRHLGRQHPGRLGLRDHQLRLVDRHRPRRHADLGHPAAAASRAGARRSTASPKR